MNRSIFKYPLMVTDQQAVSLPVGAKILCVMIQNGGLHLWADVEIGVGHEDRDIRIYGTGNPVDTTHHTYIGTVQDKQFVWHVFEHRRVQ